MNSWNLFKLVHALRFSGVLVSTQDIIDVLKCSDKFPSISEKIILKTFFVHRPQDLVIFETVWEVIFPYDIQDKKQAALPSFLNHNSIFASGGQKIGHGSGGTSITQGKVPFPQFSFLSMDSNITDLENELESSVKERLADLNYYAWINSADLAYKREEISEQEWLNYHEQGETLEKLIRQKLLTLQIELQNSWLPLKRQHWRYKTLKNLTKDEKKEVQLAIKQWGKKLAVRSGHKWRNSKSGTINIHQTIKNAFWHNGKIFKLHHYKKIPYIPELVVLCDVSNSVAPYVEFLLYLVGNIRSRYRKVRLFFFIDTIWDISDHIWDYDSAEIFEEIESWGRKASSGFSDYGNVLKEFAESILPEISYKTTVLILGDGKNNYRPPQEENLRFIKESVRRLYWLNPLDPQEWDARENALKFYSTYCTQIFKCRTVDDLKQIAQKIF